MSEHKQIAAALVKAQRAFGPALKDKTNPAFRSKYADLGACLDAVMDALNEAGIALIQKQHPHDGGVCVETVFIHESGETCSAGMLTVPASKQDPQGYGSALTYARRYSLMSACGIAPEDDDGAAASKPKQHSPQKVLTSPDPNTGEVRWVNGEPPERAAWLKGWLEAIAMAPTVGECKRLTIEAAGEARAEHDSEAESQFLAAQAAKMAQAKKATT